MKTRILLVDDDHGPMNYFVDALRQRGFEVEHVDTVDGFFDRLDRAPTTPDFDIAIIDMMMPFGTRLNQEETEAGLKSGVEIAKAIRKKYPFLEPESLAGPGHVHAIRKKYPSLPIVVFSNLREPTLLDLLPADVKVKAKFEIAPFDFADFISTLVPPRP